MSTALIARGPVARPEPPRPTALTPSRRPASSLETFVSGPSNRMAVAAVELAATRPGEISPLVIHGASGVGKSHLLESLCGRFRELHPEATTVILSAEQFTTSFLQALHGSGLQGFRRACRGADVLVIDDLQFFVGKRATLMEVQQTVDALLREGRQVVFAADRDPASLDGLGSELIARLQGGIVTRIEPPDYDVRRGIVSSVAARRGLDLPDEVVHYVATHMTRHARELIGAVNRLEAASHMLGLPITAGVAAEALADLVRSSGRSVRLADVERAVCTAFGIEAGSLQSARRSRSASHPRMLAMFLARRHTSSALAEIGGYFGRRSHSTVISAQKTVDDWIARRARVLLADAEWDVEEAIRRVEEILRG
jgi:chromosomal replication initiator protein